MFKKLFQFITSALIFFIMLFIFGLSLTMAIFSSELSAIDLWQLIVSLHGYGCSNNYIQGRVKALLSINKKYSDMFFKNFKEIINNELYDDKLVLISYELSLDANRSQISHILNIFNIAQTGIFNKNYLEESSLNQVIHEGFFNFSSQIVQAYSDALRPGITNILKNSSPEIINKTLKLITENNNYNYLKAFLEKQGTDEKVISQIIDFCQKRSYVTLANYDKIENIVYYESLKLDQESAHISDPKNVINDFIKTMRQDNEINTTEEFNDLQKYIRDNTKKSLAMKFAFSKMNTDTKDQNSGYTVADIIGFTWYCLKNIDTDDINKNLFINEIEKVLKTERDVIEANGQIKKGQPLCFVGQYKGIISFLSGIHPKFNIEEPCHDMLCKNIHDFFYEKISKNRYYQQLITSEKINEMLDDMSDNMIFGNAGELYKKLKEITKADRQTERYCDKNYYEYYNWEKLVDEIKKTSIDLCTHTPCRTTIQL